MNRVIAGAPHATLVAIYSGRDDHGELRIVVRDGYHASVDQLTRFGTGNIVDLPALQWLATQRGPRIWISDGGVTGCNDIFGQGIEWTCHKICRETGILRVEDADAAAAALSSMRVDRQGRLPRAAVHAALEPRSSRVRRRHERWLSAGVELGPDASRRFRKRLTRRRG